MINALGLGGGAEHSLASMLPLLRERGIDSSVACIFPRHGGLQARVRDDGFDVEILRSTSWPGRIRALRRLILTTSPALVHATLFHSCLVTRLACAGVDVARLDSMVNTMYDPVRVHQLGIAPWKLAAVRGLDATTARLLGDHFHAISETVKREATEVLGIAPRRITVIPRGRSLAQIGERTVERRREVRHRLGLPADAFVFLNVARQDPQKAQADLVHAFGLVRRVESGCILLIAGRLGAASVDLHRSLDGHAASDSVRWLGHRDDVFDLYAAADVFVFPSLYEGLGCAVIEAMALSLPIIGSDAPAVAELLGGGRFGVVVPRADPETMAQQMLRLMSDGRLRDELGAVARQRFLERYDLDHVADATASMYRQRLADRMP